MITRASLYLIGVVFLAYWNSFAGVFQFDDFNVIVGNPAVHSFQAWLLDSLSGIRPVLKMTYMLNWVGGVGAFGFHLVNTMIHALNAILIYHLSRIFLKNREADTPNETAFLCALLFALHPAQTEAVTYICGRSASLMTTFYLGSLLAYVHGIRSKNFWLLYAASPFLFALAVLTKESAITLPFALVLWEWFGAPQPSWKNAFKNSAVHWGLLFSGLIALWVHPGYAKLFQSTFRLQGVGQSLLTQINGIYYLISRVFLLKGQNIDPDLANTSSWDISLIGKAPLLGAILWTAFFCFRRKIVLGFGIAWFLLQLVPTNSLIQRNDIANDRHFYLASWGVFLALSIGFSSLAGRFQQGRKLRLGGVVLLSLALFLFTGDRNEAYRSEVSLWEDTASKSLSKARVYNNLGYAYYLSGRYQDAQKAYLMALHLNPDNSLFHNNLILVEKILEEKGEKSPEFGRQNRM